MEYLIHDEGNQFSFAGNVSEDLLSITSVHPMTEGAVKVFINKAKSDWSVVEELVKRNKLLKTQYNEKIFYYSKTIIC